MDGQNLNAYEASKAVANASLMFHTKDPLMASRGAVRKRVLAIASGGGHWEQLMLLRDAFKDQDVTFATTIAGLGARAGVPTKHVPDCNRNKPAQALASACAIALMILRLRPHIIVTTGALPGVIALAIGRIMRSRTIWIDSIANAEEMSMAGKQAKPFADLWLSQWEAVSAMTGARFAGSVL